MTLPFAMSASDAHQARLEQHQQYAHYHTDAKLTEPGPGWETQPMQQHPPAPQPDKKGKKDKKDKKK